MRRTAALILPLLALAAIAGCRSFCAYDPNTHVFVFAGSTLTSPTVADAGGALKTPTTQVTWYVKGYGSKSEVTGADIASLAASIAKIFLAVP